METRCGHTDVALIQINVGRPGGSTEAVQRRTCAKSRRELKRSAVNRRFAGVAPGWLIVFGWQVRRHEIEVR